MTTFTPLQSDFVTRVLTATAILGPILLVVIAGTLPQGVRGNLVVNGHIFIVAALATALALRVVYRMGFSCAHKLVASSLDRSLLE